MQTIISLDKINPVAQNLQRALNCQLVVPETKKFRDNETYIRIKTDLSNHEVLIVQSLYYPQEFHLFQVLNLAYLIKRLGATSIKLIAPYMCYSRADRDILGGEAVSLLTVLSLIKASPINELIVVDLHNPSAIPDEISKKLKISNVLPTKSIKNFLSATVGEIDSEWSVVAPDKGAEYRAKELAELLKIRYTSFEKHRDPITGTVNLRNIDDVNIIGTKVILIDDMVTTGNSLLQVVKILKKKKIQKVCVIVTHSLTNNLIEKFQDTKIDILASTLSVPSEISKIDITPDLLDTISF